MRHKRQSQLINIQIPQTATHEKIHPRPPYRNPVRSIPVQTRPRPFFGPSYPSRPPFRPSLDGPLDRGAAAQPSHAVSEGGASAPPQSPRALLARRRGQFPVLVELEGPPHGGLGGLDPLRVLEGFHPRRVGAPFLPRVLASDGVVPGVLAEVHGDDPGEEVDVGTASFLGGAAGVFGVAVAVDEDGVVVGEVVVGDEDVVAGVESHFATEDGGFSIGAGGEGGAAVVDVAAAVEVAVMEGIVAGGAIVARSRRAAADAYPINLVVVQ
mmetsp:Transcript_5618/g.12246  ORF Transcript_5618/g.12246 Transcript_5618/m.12246 type:complete len:268 (-) Transcript_5618:1031-1834(-)